jgi:hypothetical protein
MARGLLASGPAVMTLMQFASVAVMAALPFAVRKTKKTLGLIVLIGFGAILFALNNWNALDLLSHVRESATADARGTLQKAEALKSRIAGLEKSRRELPPFVSTSGFMVSAAQESVRAAETARDAECRVVAEKCRKRVDEVTAAQKELAALSARRELTEKAAGLDAQIAEANAGLVQLGPLPKYADAGAAKIVRVLSLVMTLAPGADDTVSEWRPILMVLGVELLALLGPFTAFAAFGISDRAPVPPPVGRSTVRKVAKPPVQAASPLPVPAKAPAKASARTSAPKAKQEDGPGLKDVRDWFEARTAPRAGNLVRVGECYASYQAWCEETNRTAVKLTAFGKLMKGELKVDYQEKSKRGYYIGIVLKSALKLVASADS